jgi:hypothetical protein
MPIARNLSSSSRIAFFDSLANHVGIHAISSKNSCSALSPADGIWPLSRMVQNPELPLEQRTMSLFAATGCFLRPANDEAVQ